MYVDRRILMRSILLFYNAYDLALLSGIWWWLILLHSIVRIIVYVIFIYCAYEDAYAYAYANACKICLNMRGKSASYNVEYEL